ncbi:MAG TPA: class I SAM-dependent methyltransferase [Nitrososphaerales archaeon]|nr:class I SAM-dependent methyltransferase [Nitrososphaerales archaeon]
MKLTFTERFRSLFQEPYTAAKEIGISEGQNVADIGAGKGYLTIPASTIVGRKGLVYSIEPDPARSKKIRERVANAGLENVRILTTGAEQLEEIPSDTVDLAFSVFSMHHFNDKQASLVEIRRILRNGGRFYVWDRVPGTIMRHGTRPAELDRLSGDFTRFELLSTGRTVRARFTK